MKYVKEVIAALVEGVKKTRYALTVIGGTILTYCSIMLCAIELDNHIANMVVMVVGIRTTYKVADWIRQRYAVED